MQEQPKRILTVADRDFEYLAIGAGFCSILCRPNALRANDAMAGNIILPEWIGERLWHHLRSLSDVGREAPAGH